jgi:uncharacterized protein Yka (UPF0111/DUF47 family)
MPFKKLFGRDTRFFDFLEAGAAEAKEGAAILGKLLPMLGHGSTDTTLNDLAQSRRKHKRIAQDTTEAVTKTFVTPIDREDIEGLSDALYKISKTIEKIGERLIICPPGARMQNIEKQVAMLGNATGVVQSLVGRLRSGATGDSIKADYEMIQSIEGDADKVMQESLRDLYHSQDDARLVVFWKDIFELLEKAIDRCRDSGNEIFHIVLKYS